MGGDFNAVVGRKNDVDYDNRIQITACGQFGFGERTQRGQRLVQFCMQENLTTANTCFDQNTRAVMDAQEYRTTWNKQLPSN